MQEKSGYPGRLRKSLAPIVRHHRSWHRNQTFRYGMTKKKANAGFTLIEVMVVVVILGILASIVVPRIMDRPDMARATKAKVDIQNIESALSLYRMDHFQYPSTDEGLEALVSGKNTATKGGHRGGYLARVPKDPWGNPYLYLQPGQHGEVDIYTLGADGQSGGEGANIDIGNWDLQ